jgi:two-component system chemotaxis sensor kinase CheA
MMRILAADDSASMREMVRMSLGSAGFDVTSAADGEEALRLAAATPFDLVLLDVNMPVRDGFDVIRALRADAQYRHTPILMLTTESSPDRKREGKSAGATGWIVKPFDPAQLIATCASRVAEVSHDARPRTIHDAFFDESFEALDTMEAALLKLNVGAPELEIVNTIFRVAHSIKGGSATFGFADVASFTHTCETLLDELRGNRMQVTRAITDLLLKSVDIMREMLRAVQHKTPIDAQRVADLQFDLELAIVQNKAPAAAQLSRRCRSRSQQQEPTRAATRHRWRIQFRPYPQLFAHGNDPLRMLRELADLGDLHVTFDQERARAGDLDPESCYLSWELTVDTDATREVIDQVFDWAEGDCELQIRDENVAAAAVIAKPISVAVETKAAETPRAAPPAEEPTKQSLGDGSSIRVSTEKVDELMNTVGELVITQSMLTQLGTKLTGSLAEQIRAGLAQLERNVRELQESVMRVRMLPISFVFSRFPRMVRDLSGRLGKQVELKVTGDQTELDKTVLEKIGDPLVHLVRNSVDHGIEMPRTCARRGKPRAASSRSRRITRAATSSWK